MHNVAGPPASVYGLSCTVIPKCSSLLLATTFLTSVHAVPLSNLSYLAQNKVQFDCGAMYIMFCSECNALFSLTY